MNTTASALLGPNISLAVGFEIGVLLVQRIQFSSRRKSEIRISAEVVPGLVELEVAVPGLETCRVVGVGRSAKNTNRRGPP